jgi:outer membrane receptor protein involved in Fe transport
MSLSKYFFRLSVCFLVLGIFVPGSRAQFKASLQGTVTDAKGGAVSGATVSITREDTGLNRSTVTSEEGFYRISELAPGRYTVSVEATGFKTSISKEVSVEAEQPRGFDVVLEVGAVSDQVTVTASGDALQTENANTSNTITAQEIHQLPQFGRDPYELIRLTPGVFGDGSRSGDGTANNLPNASGPGGSVQSIFQIENQVQVVANGQRTASNNFTIDGVSVNSLGFGGTAVITPNQDSVQEITILSNSYSAEDGRGSGAQVKVVSKSGSNQLHGAGFFNYQSPNWNAYNKYGGPGGAAPVRVNNKYRQFGGDLGGPIWKDKLFFFFSYEGLRNNKNDTSDALFVETPEFRSLVAAARPGSIASTILTSAGVAPRIASVLNATCDDAGISDPTQCQVVQGGLDVGSPTGAQGQYVPLDGAHFAGGGLDGIPDMQEVTLRLPGTQSGNQYNGRFDLNLGKNQFSFSSYFTMVDNIDSDAAGRSRPQGDLAIQPFNQTEAVSWIRAFTPTLVNEFRVNFTRFHFDQVSTNANVDFGIPRIEIEGYNFDRIRFGADRAETTPAIFTENTISLRDKVSKSINAHALSMGVDFTAEQDNNDLSGGARPLYSNVRLWNFANDTPIFEAINVSPQTGAPADAQRYLRSKTYGFYFQDDWKVKPNFTLNLGLRYEYYSPLNDKNGQLTNLVRGSDGTLAGASVIPVSRLYNSDRNNFGPRLGFAWSPTRFHNNTVVRGGFGLAYNRPDDVLFANSRANPPNFARFNLCCGTSAADFSTPFDGGAILYALGSSNSALSYPANPALAFGIDPTNGGVCGDAACTFDQSVEIYGGYPNYRDSYVYLYSMEIERRLPWGLFSTIGYQGSAGHKITRLVNQNFLEQPNTAFFAVYFPTSDVNSNYNALNLRLRKQMSHGLLFDAIYRYSKSIDQLSNEGPGAQTNQTDPAHPQTEHGPSDFDVTHNFSFYTLWDLPIFRNQSGFAGKVLGGWQVNGILSAHSGFPWTPVTGTQNSVPVTGADTINPTRPIGVLADWNHDYSNSTFTTPGGNFPNGGPTYFDITQPGPPGIGRNSQRGPHYFDVDFSVVKKFGLPTMKVFGEGANIELRGNFYNVFNKLNLQSIAFGSDQARIENSRFGTSPGGLAGRVIEFHARFNF